MGSLTRRQIAFVVGVVAALLLVYATIHYLVQLRHAFYPETYLQRIAVVLVAFCIPVFTTWLRFKWVGVNILTLTFLIPLILFVVSITKLPVFLWIFLVYGTLMAILSQMEQHFEGQIGMIGIEEEKYQDETNNLEMTFKAKGEGISTFFEKYSTYYNLRKLAEELTVSLAWGELAQKAVDRAMDFIPRGGLLQDHARARGRKNASSRRAAPHAARGELGGQAGRSF